MSTQERDSGSTARSVSSRIPLEILVPFVCSLIILCVMAVVFARQSFRERGGLAKDLDASPSMLVLSDPEANRRWLNELASMKELGFEGLKSVARVLSLEVKCRGEGVLDDKVYLVGLPARPQSALLPGWRSRSSRRGIVRESWLQGLFRSSQKHLASENMHSIPEIRITVPTSDDGPDPKLPQNRRWSRIIARDINLAVKIPSSFRPLALVDNMRGCNPPADRNEHRSEYPPNSMHTLPIPARRRLSLSTDTVSCLRRDCYVIPRPLSPIVEAHESMSSFQGSLMSSYGLTLLRSTPSILVNPSGSADFHNSVEPKGITKCDCNESPAFCHPSSLPDAPSIRSVRSPLPKSKLHNTDSSSVLPLISSSSGTNRDGCSSDAAVSSVESRVTYS